MKVLIADDEPQLLRLVARHLKKLGHDVVQAGDGDSAWLAAQAHRPELALLDCVMPGMSGREVCRRIKHAVAAAGLAETVVILLTSVEDGLRASKSASLAAVKDKG